MKKSIGIVTYISVRFVSFFLHHHRTLKEDLITWHAYFAQQYVYIITIIYGIIYIREIIWSHTYRMFMRTTIYESNIIDNNLTDLTTYPS